MTTGKKITKRHDQGRKKEQTANSVEKASPEHGHAFHVVGIGASAGGLEALGTVFQKYAARQRHGICRCPAS